MLCFLWGARLSAFQISCRKIQTNGTLLLVWLAVLAGWLIPGAAAAQTLSDADLAQIRFEQKQGAQIALDLPFRDESGTEVRLGQYMGGKPVVLVLGYYECPMLCTLVLNGFTESASDMKWSIGREFEVVNVSINPQETPVLAAAKKRAYVRRYGRAPAAEGWHFLTGDKTAIRQLADQVGFRYAYNASTRQYAHPSGLVVLTPQGRISTYLFGVTYAPAELYAALRNASLSQVGSPIQQFILLCFHYNPLTGKYSRLIFIVLRSLSVATMLGFIWLIVRLVRRGRAAEMSLAGSSVLPALPATEAPGGHPVGGETAARAGLSRKEAGL